MISQITVENPNKKILENVQMHHIRELFSCNTFIMSDLCMPEIVSTLVT